MCKCKLQEEHWHDTLLTPLVIHNTVWNKHPMVCTYCCPNPSKVQVLVGFLDNISLRCSTVIVTSLSATVRSRKSEKMTI